MLLATANIRRVTPCAISRVNNAGVRVMPIAAEKYFGDWVP